MILDRPLSAARDHDNLSDARFDRFFHDVLDHGLVDDGQHFLGGRFGHGQKTGPVTGQGEDGFPDFLHGHLQMSMSLQSQRGMIRYASSNRAKVLPKDGKVGRKEYRDVGMME